MLRATLNEAMKDAMRQKDQRALSTVRLILAALKDRDISARGNGNPAGIGDDEILAMLQAMVKQRRESIALYEQGGRLELAQQEQEEIEVIERFLPAQMTEAEIEQAVSATMAEIGAQNLKDMGRLMAALKERYAGRMDLARAGALAKKHLA
ncbi:GatB/YqeY domain-containing protein [Pararhodospirillum oryzae]|uniref:Aspartyl-tRNA amidotransferase subunit B n=1 Tax=Pararhodospirillum oryzae TaxID=478448 RepID=A0A512H454_9PROT|nr:GatB/YqeY domain-containing protein [Pararhodospirillum oryzae]GEO80254.1 aspartyl-tRNA amidotransferase subunit B [Pararhodospirillum oryzae]